jgi:hypothetical protein
MSPMVVSLLAEMVPTWAISLWSLIGLESFLQRGDGDFDGLVDAALDLHRVVAGGDQLDPFAVDRLGQNGGGGGAVTGDVGGLGSDFLDQLGAHVLELVLQFDLLGDGHAVLGDQGSAEGFVEDDVAALGAEGHLDRIGQGVDPFENFVAGVLPEFDFFGCHGAMSSLSG